MIQVQHLQKDSVNPCLVVWRFTFRATDHFKLIAMDSNTFYKALSPLHKRTLI